VLGNSIFGEDSGGDSCERVQFVCV